MPDPTPLATRAWQGSPLARVCLLRGEWARRADPQDPAAAEFTRLLQRAETTASAQRGGRWLSGTAVESAWSDLHAAEALLAGAVRGSQPRPELEEQLARTKAGAIHQRARTFRAMVLGAAVLVAGSVAGLTVLGFLSPSSVPMCTADGTTCVTAGNDRDLDVAVVAVIGAAAGTLSGTVSLRRLRGTTTPYRVPMALALLKMPTGALTAVLGVLLLRSGLAGTTLEPSSGATLLGVVVLLGLAQELLTRLVDQQGEAVLAEVRGSSAGSRG